MAPIKSKAVLQMQPRARGQGYLHVRAKPAGQTRLQDLRQSGATKLIFPNTYRKDAEAILVNTAGGITGGDRFSLGAEIGENARLSLTTQAAERAYRAQPDEIAQVDTKLMVKNHAHLNWLPQELILFENCALQRRLSIDLQSEATLLMVEPMVLGRTAMHEDLRQIFFRDRIAISRNNRPLYHDGIDLCGDALAQMARAATGAGAKAMASLVYVAKDAPAQLAICRKLLPRKAGASVIGDDMLVLRCLASDGHALRQALIPILDHLTNDTLPVSWRL